MGKFDLGVPTSKLVGIDSNNLYINNDKVATLENDIEEQLDSIRLSLLDASSLLNKVVKQGYVKGTRIQIYKGWSRKAKSQADSAEKLKNTISNSYKEDLQNYTLMLLDKRIADLESKIDLISRGE